MQQIEHFDHIFVPRALVGLDHDGLIALLLPLENPCQQLIARHADFGRLGRFVLEAKRLVVVERDHEGLRRNRELAAHRWQLDLSGRYQRRRDHEDHEEHQHDVDVWNDVDLVDRLANAAHRVGPVAYRV